MKVTYMLGDLEDYMSHRDDKLRKVTADVKMASHLKRVVKTLKKSGIEYLLGEDGYIGFWKHELSDAEIIELIRKTYVNAINHHYYNDAHLHNLGWLAGEAHGKSRTDDDMLKAAKGLGFSNVPEAFRVGWKFGYY